MPADEGEIGLFRDSRHDGTQDEECVIAVLKLCARREMRPRLPPDDGQRAVHHLVEALPVQSLRRTGAEGWSAARGGVGAGVFLETPLALLRELRDRNPPAARRNGLARRIGRLLLRRPWARPR